MEDLQTAQVAQMILIPSGIGFQRARVQQCVMDRVIRRKVPQNRDGLLLLSWRLISEPTRQFVQGHLAIRADPSHG